MSRRCSEVQQEIALLLLEEPAGGAGGAALLAHLKECSRCALDEENLRALLGSLGGQDIPDPGEAYWRGFLPRVRRRIAFESSVAASRRSGWIGRWALAVSAASFVLAALAVSRWSTPTEIQARTQFQRLAGQRISQASPGALPFDAEAVRGPDGDDGSSVESDIERVLEETLPQDDSDVYSSASELGSEERRRLEKTLGLDWV
jgi:hypothetical protein